MEGMVAIYTDKIIQGYSRTLKYGTGSQLMDILDVTRDELIGQVVSAYFPEGTPAHAAISGRLDEALPPLEIPPLPVREEIPPRRYALAAAIGVLLGTILLGSPLRLAGLDDGARFFFSGLVGATLMTYLFSIVSKSKWFQRAICAAVGVGTILEFWVMLSSFGRLSSLIRGRLSDKGRGKRLASYLLMGLYLIISRPIIVEPDRKEVEEVMKKSLGLWIHYADHMARDYLKEGKEDTLSIEGIPVGLADKIHKLHNSSKDEVEVVALEILQEAKKTGLEGLEGSPAFKEGGTTHQDRISWEPELLKLYNVYGSVEEGDIVVIEDAPLILGDEILRKGLVRKAKGRAR